MSPAYLDPRTGQTFPLDQPRWCGPDHAPLLLTPLPGIDPRPDRHRHAQPLALSRRVPDAGRRSDHHGRGLHAADPPHAARRAGAAEMRVVHARPAASRTAAPASCCRCCARRACATCWRTVPATAAPRCPPTPPPAGMRATIMAPASTSPAKTVQMRAHGATVELIPGTRQDTADAAVRRSETDLLCQPQLASVLPARHQDPGLRTVGGPRLPRARQHHHAVRRRIERAGLRDRLFRTAARRRDRRHAAHLRRPAGELRADRRGVPCRQRCAGRHRDPARPSPRAPRSRSRSGSPRSSARCARRAAAR